MGNKLNKKKKKKMVLENKDEYKYLDNFEEKNDLIEQNKKEKDFIYYQQDIDFSKKLELITKFRFINNDKYNSLILNDGSIAKIIDNSLLIYNRHNFKNIINIKAKNEIYNFYQLQNGKLIIIFEYFFNIYKIKKDKLILLQNIKFENFQHDKYKYAKMVNNGKIKRYYSPELIELSTEKFIIKFLTKEYPTEKRPYTEYDSPGLIINIYAFDKITNKYIFKDYVKNSIGIISRILDTFIMHNRCDSVCIYKECAIYSTNKYYPLKVFIEGRSDEYNPTSKFKNFIWKNKYFIFVKYSHTEIYEFDKDYNEKKIKEIKEIFSPMTDCIFYYNSYNPIFFCSNGGYTINKLIQYNDNFEENELIINADNKYIIKKILEMNFINGKIYIISSKNIYIYKLK